MLLDRDCVRLRLFVFSVASHCDAPLPDASVLNHYGGQARFSTVPSQRILQRAALGNPSHARHPRSQPLSTCSGRHDIRVRHGLCARTARLLALRVNKGQKEEKKGGGNHASGPSHGVVRWRGGQVSCSSRPSFVLFFCLGLHIQSFNCKHDATCSVLLSNTLLTTVVMYYIANNISFEATTTGPAPRPAIAAARTPPAPHEPCPQQGQTPHQGAQDPSPNTTATTAAAWPWAAHFLARAPTTTMLRLERMFVSCTSST